MKFQIIQKHLNDCLKNVAPFIDRNQHLDSVKNILLKTNGNTLEVSATNMETEIVQKLPGSCKQQGEITVPAGLFKDYIANLALIDSEKEAVTKINLELTKNKLQITCLKTKGAITGLAPEYVRLPFKKQAKPILELKANELRQALEQVVFAASNDISRPVVNGIYLHFIDGDFCLVGCDSYRLAEKKIKDVLKKATKAAQADFQVIVPVRNFLKLSRVLSSYPDKKVSIYRDEDKQRLAFIFDDGEIEVASNLVDGTYPNYIDLLPTDFKTEITMDKRALSITTNRIALFVREPVPSIVLTWSKSNKTLNVKSVDSQMGNTEDDMPVKIKAGKTSQTETITLNVKHLQDVLQVMEAEQVTLKLKGDKLQPCVLFDAKDTKNFDYQHVLMPMRS